MSFIQRFLLGNRVEDDLQVGIFLKNDGTVWLRNPDGSETQVGAGGGGLPPGWSQNEVVSASGDPDGSDLTLAGGVGASGDGGDVILQGGDGDDSDGSVQIEGVAIFTKQGVFFSANVEVTYDDGQLGITDAGGGIGVDFQMVGIMQIQRGDPVAYPDTGSNYILFVTDPSTELTWGVTPAGYEYFDNPNEVGAPDDADLNAFQRRQWYDPASGAPAFRFKQKDADGTVSVGHSVGITDDGVIKLPGLPTADPHVADQLWNSAGTLKVSAG